MIRSTAGRDRTIPVYRVLDELLEPEPPRRGTVMHRPRPYLRRFTASSPRCAHGPARAWAAARALPGRSARRGDLRDHRTRSASRSPIGSTPGRPTLFGLPLHFCRPRADRVRLVAVLDEPPDDPPRVLRATELVVPAHGSHPTPRWQTGQPFRSSGSVAVCPQFSHRQKSSVSPDSEARS